MSESDQTVATPRERTDTLQRVELAEGVEIRLPIAGPGARAMAWLIDTLIRGAAITVASIVFTIVGAATGGEFATGIFLIFMFGVSWFYTILFEAGKKGATPGKRSMNLRVVTLSGAPIGISQSIARNLLRAVDFLPVGYGIGLVATLFTKRFQRLGDLAAGTVVIYGNRPEPMRRPTNSRPVIAVAPKSPPVLLRREEQQALIAFADRLPTWSAERAKEIGNHAEPLTGFRGEEGTRQLTAMANYIKEGKS